MGEMEKRSKDFFVMLYRPSGYTPLVDGDNHDPGMAKFETGDLARAFGFEVFKMGTGD